MSPTWNFSPVLFASRTTSAHSLGCSSPHTVIALNRSHSFLNACCAAGVRSTSTLFTGLATSKLSGN
eukprot:5886353-Alexandrium_andersonii.AAC.1